METPFSFWIWALVAFAFVALVVGVLRRMSRQRAERDALEADAAIRHEIAAGIRLADGKPACVICSEAEAKHPLPIIGLSWFERLNPLRSLYGSAHLYRRLAGSDFESPLLCTADLTLYEALVDDQLAEIRRDSARFSSEVDRRVSRLRAGETLALARLERYRSDRALGAEYPALASASRGPTLRLDAPIAEDEDEQAVSAQTTNGVPIERHPEMTN